MAEPPRAASAASASFAHDAVNRRRLIAASGAAALALDAVAAKPTRMKPQPGDLLAHAFGDRAGELISPEDVGAERFRRFRCTPRFASCATVRCTTSCSSCASMPQR